MKLLSICLKSLVVGLLAIILTTCKKNDGNRYKEQLIGTWKSTRPSIKSYTFQDNNTFIDTTFYLYQSPSDYKVLEIVTGDYLIKDGELTFSNIQLTYFDGQDKDAVYHYLRIYDSDYKVSFKTDVMILNQKSVFESNEKNSAIIGKWSYNKLAIAFDGDLENKYSTGVLKGSYDFKSDSNVDWQYEVKFPDRTTTGNQSSTYYLDDSLLTIDQLSIYDVKISFSEEKMIWLYPDLTFQRK